MKQLVRLIAIVLLALVGGHMAIHTAEGSYISYFGVGLFIIAIWGLVDLALDGD